MAAISPVESVNNQLGIDIRRTRKSGQDARGEIARLMNKVESTATTHRGLQGTPTGDEIAPPMRDARSRIDVTLGQSAVG